MEAVRTSRGRVSHRPLEFWKNERLEYDINKEVKSFSQASLPPTPEPLRQVSCSDGSASETKSHTGTPASSRGASAALKRQQPPATSASAAQSRRKRGKQNTVTELRSTACQAEKSEWTGTHTWTIDYAKMRRKAKTGQESWIHSDPFVIGGQEFTFMVSGTGFEKNDLTPFGVFLCPSDISNQLSGCLLTRFKIHLRFNGVDPLPSGQSACKDFWDDETEGGCFGWGFETYCASVTHRDLVDPSSPYFQGTANRPIIIVEVRFCPPPANQQLIRLAVVPQNMQGLRRIHPRKCHIAVLHHALPSLYYCNTLSGTPRTCARKRAMSA